MIKVESPSDKPIVISEFGGYSLKIIDHTYGDKVYGYKTFESREEFEDAVTKLYLDEVAPLIDQGICALIHTQLSDIEDEINGFITYDRKKIKVDPKRIKRTMDLLYQKL